jgi:hypothetical protein
MKIYIFLTIFTNIIIKRTYCVENYYSCSYLSLSKKRVVFSNDFSMAETKWFE